MDRSLRLNTPTTVVAAALCGCVLLSSHSQAADDGIRDVEKIVAEVTGETMRRYGIPGMAVGIVTAENRAVYDFGAMSKATAKPVRRDTLFEIGSLSKAFTATLVFPMPRPAATFPCPTLPANIFHRSAAAVWTMSAC